MALSSLSVRWWLKLVALVLAVAGFNCGGDTPKPPPPTEEADATHSKVEVSRAANVVADGKDSVTVTVTVLTASDTPLANQTVTLEVTGEGATVSPASGKTNAQGVMSATLVSTSAGTKQVKASVSTSGGALPLSTQPTVEFVAPAQATKLVFTTASIQGVAGAPLGPVLEVAVQDADGNTVTGNTSAVTLELATGPASAQLGGTLKVNAVNGVARFTDANISLAGTGYSLRATSGSLTPALSTTFDVVAAAPSRVVLTGLPATVTAGTPVSVTVTVQDAFGNVTTGYTGTVHFTSTDANAVLTDYTFSASDAGTASVPVELRTAGVNTLTASGTDLTTTDTASTTVSAAEAAQLVFSTQPVNGTVRAMLATVRVAVEDAYGNVVSAGASTVTLGLSSGSVLATLSGTQSVDPVNGVAAFTDLSIDQEGTGFQLMAISGSLPTAASSSFTIVDDLAPAAALITATPASGSSVTVSWTAVGDDGNLGTAASYDLRYAGTPITNDAEFNAATHFGISAPQAAGTAESALVTGLSLSADVYFALKVIDGAGNSSLSNSPKVSGSVCAGVTCTPPASTCTANGRGVISYTSACVDSGGTGMCQDTPSTALCQSYETCSAGACVPVTGTAQAGSVIISEFSALGSEFIELRNTGAADADIHGFTLRNAAGDEVDIRAVTDPNGTAGTPVTVPANSVLYGIPNPSGSIPGGTGFVYGEPGTPFALADTGDALALYASNGGSLEDAVDFRSFVTNPDTPLVASNFVGFAGSSTQLDSSVATAADNDTATNWCVSFYGNGVRGSRVTNTAGGLNGSCKVAVINEVIIDAPGGDDMKTFVELAGPGGSVIGGAKITDVEGSDTNPNFTAGSLHTDGNYAPGETDGEFVIPAGKRFPADGILLIADANNAGNATSVPGFVKNVDVLARDMDMEDGGGDSIQLVSATGALLDALGQSVNGSNLATNTAYNMLAMYEGATALYPPNPSGTWADSLARSPDSADTDNNRNDFHIDPSPTPGQPNDAVNFTVVGVSPNNMPALATSSMVVTVTGTDFSPGMRLQTSANSTSVNCDNVISSTSATCKVGGASATAIRADVIGINPASVGVPNAVLSNSFTYTGKENETDSAMEADFCNLQYPSTLSVKTGTVTELIYGQIYEAGVTEAPGAASGIQAEVGYGNNGTDPTTDVSWRFFSAGYNVQSGNNDEYMGTFTAPAAGTYAYTFRFSQDGGLNWTYCDLNGAGSNAGLTFESTQLGTMTVTP